MEQLTVIKIGGNVIDDDTVLHSFLESFATLKGKKILVHGGGKLATRLAEQMGVKQQLVDGRRITDAETLKIVTMVYGGYVNKNIVARLQSLQCTALGLTGADMDLVPAIKRPLKNDIDYGFVGDLVPGADTQRWRWLLDSAVTPVMAPLTHDGLGQLLNTNADTIAQEIATLLSPFYKVQLIYLFEKRGVLLDAEQEDSVIPVINPVRYAQLKEENIVSAGMLPKLDNAFAALNNGVAQVIIGQSQQLSHIIAGTAGTRITHD